MLQEQQRAFRSKKSLLKHDCSQRETHLFVTTVLRRNGKKYLHKYDYIIKTITFKSTIESKIIM